MKDLIRRDSARRIIESPRSKEQMLTILQSLPSEDEPISCGVFVKGWNIPDGCISCPFFSGQGCKATMRLFPDWVNVATRPDGCPLSEYNPPPNYVVNDPNEGNDNEGQRRRKYLWD